MEEAWDRRAKQNSIRYVADQHLGEDFFNEGTKLAGELCTPFFVAEGFVPEGKRMLDIGCGIGRLERGFSKMFAEVWGLDVSGEMISQAKELNRGYHNVTFVKGNGEDLDIFPDDNFDFVFSYITFQHIPDKSIIKSYLKEVHRVLKKDGLVKILIRKPWSGFAFAFGFVPIPRVILRYIPEPVWSVYDRLAYRGEKVPYRGRTWRGVGVSAKEVRHYVKNMDFKKVEIQEDASNSVYWLLGKK